MLNLKSSTKSFEQLEFTYRSRLTLKEIEVSQPDILGL